MLEGKRALLDARGFGPDDFARSHPGGSLGRRLLTHVRDVMRTGDSVPTVSPQTGVTDAILAMSRGGLGLVAVLDDDGRTLGIFTDGDLRRAFEKRIDLRSARIDSVMHAGPRTIGPDRLAVEAVEMMERYRINALLAAETGQPEDKVARDSDRNFWMTAEEALEYNLINKIITRVDEIG